MRIDLNELKGEARKRKVEGEEARERERKGGGERKRNRTKKLD